MYSHKGDIVDEGDAFHVFIKLLDRKILDLDTDTHTQKAHHVTDPFDKLPHLTNVIFTESLV